MINRLKPSSFEGPDVCPPRRRRTSFASGLELGNCSGCTVVTYTAILLLMRAFLMKIFRGRTIFFFSYFVHGRTYLNVSKFFILLRLRLRRTYKFHRDCNFARAMNSNLTLHYTKYCAYQIYMYILFLRKETYLCEKCEMKLHVRMGLKAKGDERG